MAVFRVERNKGYTVMSNHHLRNKELSLKAKGLLSQMLSLPEDWDYTLKGLSLINREKIDAIREAIKELERAGYIVRSRERDEKGRLRGADYVIFEQPQPPTPDLPTLENPTLDNPTQEKPTLEKPTLENPTQLNKDIQRTDLPKKEKIITDEQSTHSIPILSPNPSPCREAATPPERKGTEATAQSAVDIYREIIKDNIDYHILKQDMKFDSDRLDEIVDLMLETVCTARKRVRIAGDDYPAELVKSKFMKLDGEHIRFVLDCMRENTTKIRNIKQYLKAALFNAPSTIGNYYRLVCFDIKQLGKQLKKLGMLIVQDQVWNRVTVNRAERKSTRYFMDEFHLLLKEEQTAAYSVEIWKRFRKWGGIPTAITQNVKDLLASREVENIFENSDFVLMLNQAAGDRAILAKQLNISPQQMKYVTHTEAGEGLIFYGNVVLPFVDRFPKDTELYRVMTTKPEEVGEA